MFESLILKPLAQQILSLYNQKSLIPRQLLFLQDIQSFESITTDHQGRSKLTLGHNLEAVVETLLS